MRKGERTKEQIIRQAAVLFNRKGYAGAAISDVMAATGLEKGGIYRHFDSKDQLALAAFEHALELVNGRYLAAIRSSRHAVDRLTSIVEAFSQLQREVPIPGGCPIMNTAIDSDDGHPRLRARAQQALADWHRMLTNVVQRGLARGEIRPGVEPATVATRMIAQMEGGLMMDRLLAGAGHLERTTQGLRRWIEEMAADRKSPAEA